jgi:putative ABC transport system permease protein
LGALHDGFLDETDRAIDFFGADAWVVPANVSGPFTSNTPIDAGLVEGVRNQPDVDGATPVAIFRHVVERADSGFTDVNVIAYERNGIVIPEVSEGRAPSRAGEAAVDERLSADVGDSIVIAGRKLDVVGVVSGLTYNGGTPTVLTTLSDGQSIAFDGQDFASAIVTSGVPSTLPESLVMLTPDEVRDDLRRPLSVATTAIGIVAGLLWVVAAGIVGMMSYLSGLDRHRDFAVYKAYGVTTGRLVTSLLSEAGVVSLLAGAAAGLIAFALLPVFPVAISLSLADCVRLVGLAVLVGVIAGTLSVRGAVRVDPVVAFANT